ncbi:MAG: hypothetical protein SNJ75_08090 [Gemmataceae bacterium]
MMGIWGRFAALGMIGLASGCFTLPPREPVPLPTEMQAAQLIPQIAKNRVHAVLISGLLDPIALQGMREELIDLGFIKTTHALALVGSQSTLEKLLAEIRHKEPDARFVFVGHGSGVGLAAELATKFQAAGAAVDVFVALNPGKTVPAFSGKTICLSTDGKQIYGAENLKLIDSTHGVARDPSTLLLVVRELVASASLVQIPLVAPLAPSDNPGLLPELPQPRSMPSEWDFIRPDHTPAAIPSDKPILQAGYIPGK